MKRKRQGRPRRSLPCIIYAGKRGYFPIRIYSSAHPNCRSAPLCMAASVSASWITSISGFAPRTVFYIRSVEFFHTLVEFFHTLRKTSFAAKF